MTTDGRKLVLFCERKTVPDLENDLEKNPQLFVTLHSMRTILLIILILLLIGAFPAWPYSTGWGYYPGGRNRISPAHSDHSCGRRADLSGWRRRCESSCRDSPEAACR